MAAGQGKNVEASVLDPLLSVLVQVLARGGSFRAGCDAVAVGSAMQRALLG